jgi:hypothetical protein
MPLTDHKSIPAAVLPILLSTHVSAKVLQFPAAAEEKSSVKRDLQGRPCRFHTAAFFIRRLTKFNFTGGLMK